VLAVLPYVKPKEQARLAALARASRDAKDADWWQGSAPADDQPEMQVVVFSPRGANAVGDEGGKRRRRR
jgi:hypothetical protein